VDTAQINKMLQKYFNAFYEADAKELAKLFHEAAHIYGLDENGVLRDIDRNTFIKIIDSVAPNSKNTDFIRKDEILSIDFISKDAAVARIKLRFGDFAFTDILSLISLDGEWKVISVLETSKPI